jgi:DNA polymerase III subunit beta
MATATAAAPSARSAPPASTTPDLQFALARGALLEALTRVTTALPRRTTLPILNMMLVRPSGRELTLVCSDLDHTVETRVAATISAAAGAATLALPAKRLLEIVTSLPNSNVIEVRAKDRRAKLVAGRSKFELVGMSPDEFPLSVGESPKSAESATVNGTAFANALSRVLTHSIVAVSRPALQGALLDVDETGAFLVATDGTGRIIRIELALEHGEKPLHGKYSLPRSAVASIAKLFADDERVAISGTAQRLVLTAEHTTMYAQLVSEPFPNYAHLFNVEPHSHVILSRAPFVDALKRVAVVGEFHQVTLSFTPSDVTITAMSPDQGNAEDGVDCAFSPKSEVASPFSFMINGQYLVGALDAIAAEQVRIDFAGPHPLLYVRDAATPDARTAAVLLPVRPKGEGGR